MEYHIQSAVYKELFRVLLRSPSILYYFLVSVYPSFQRILNYHQYRSPNLFREYHAILSSACMNAISLAGALQNIQSSMAYVGSDEDLFALREAGNQAHIQVCIRPWSEIEAHQDSPEPHFSMVILPAQFIHQVIEPSFMKQFFSSQDKNMLSQLLVYVCRWNEEVCKRALKSLMRLVREWPDCMEVFYFIVSFVNHIGRECRSLKRPCIEFVMRVSPLWKDPEVAPFDQFKVELNGRADV